MARHDDAVGRDRLARQASANQLCRHKRGNLDADIARLPGEVHRRHLGQNLAQPAGGEMAGQEENAPRHRSRASIASVSSGIDSTVVVPSKALSLSTFSRSIRRGHTLTTPPGALVSSSGAVSQAKTMTGTRHLPAWA